jgi:hypothetical protein
MKLNLSEDTMRRLNNGHDVATGLIGHLLHDGAHYTHTEDFCAALWRLSLQAVSDQKQEAYTGLAELLDASRQEAGAEVAQLGPAGSSPGAVTDYLLRRDHLRECDAIGQMCDAQRRAVDLRSELIAAHKARHFAFSQGCLIGAGVALLLCAVAWLW